MDPYIEGLLTGAVWGILSGMVLGQLIIPAVIDRWILVVERRRPRGR